MGSILDQGRARRDPTTAQRIEIARRDKGCRVPGCPYCEFTDVHHMRHWTKGGLTNLDNLNHLVRPASQRRARTGLVDARRCERRSDVRQSDRADDDLGAVAYVAGSGAAAVGGEAEALGEG